MLPVEENMHYDALQKSWLSRIIRIIVRPLIPNDEDEYDCISENMSIPWNILSRKLVGWGTCRSAYCLRFLLEHALP